MATKKKEDILEETAEAVLPEEKPKRTRSKKAAEPDAELPEMGDTAGERQKEEIPDEEKAFTAPEEWGAASVEADSTAAPDELDEPHAQAGERSLQRAAPPSRVRLGGHLTPEERQEWETILASKRSNSVLTGEIIGVDANRFPQADGSIGSVLCAVLIPHRVKIIIPETEMWMPGTEKAEHVMRNMVGANIDYVILDVDVENSCAIASRRLAMMAKRRYFQVARRGHTLGEILSGNVLSVGNSVCTVECQGYDMELRANDMSYASITDLRERFAPGQEVRCVLTEYEPEENAFRVSVKLATSNPFDLADQRHPTGSRRKGVITGKYNGGVFVTLPDDVTMLCRYTQMLHDSDFAIGDSVIAQVQSYNYQRKQIFGKILVKR